MIISIWINLEVGYNFSAMEECVLWVGPCFELQTSGAIHINLNFKLLDRSPVHEGNMKISVAMCPPKQKRELLLINKDVNSDKFKTSFPNMLKGRKLTKHI